MSRLLYLDFDGPLHPAAVFDRPGIGLHLQAPGHQLFEHAPLLDEMLSPYVEIEIVLSTTWVAARSFEFACDQLPDGLRSRVIGATYTAENLKYFDAWPRGRQVTSDVVLRKPSKWFAIDDDDSGWPTSARPRLILVDANAGISTHQAQAAIRAKLKWLAGEGGHSRDT